MKATWYGERGVVNAIVTHLATLPNAEGAKKFLKWVQWADGCVPAWIGRIDRAECIVEMGLSEFGNPDIIFVCQCVKSGFGFLSKLRWWDISKA